MKSSIECCRQVPAVVSELPSGVQPWSLPKSQCGLRARFASQQGCEGVGVCCPRDVSHLPHLPKSGASISLCAAHRPCSSPSLQLLQGANGGTPTSKAQQKHCGDKGTQIRHSSIQAKPPPRRHVRCFCSPGFSQSPWSELGGVQPPGHPALPLSPLVICCLVPRLQGGCRPGYSPAPGLLGAWAHLIPLLLSPLPRAGSGCSLHPASDPWCGHMCESWCQGDCPHSRTASPQLQQERLMATDLGHQTLAGGQTQATSNFFVYFILF